MSNQNLMMQKHDRWTPLLVLTTYAILGGLSFPFFHDSMVELFVNESSPATTWVLLADLIYIGLTTILIILLISRMMRIIQQYEMALAKSEERLRNLIETSSDLVWEMDTQFRYTFVGAKVQELFGYSKDEVIGKTPFSFMSEQVATRALDHFTKLLEKKESFHLLELQYLDRDMQTVIVESSGTPIYDAQGTLCGYQGIDRNVTERRQVEETLERSSQFYRSLFDDFALPIWRSDTRGMIIYGNDAARAYLGRAQEEVGYQLGDVHPDDHDMYFEAYQRSIRALLPFSLRYRLRYKNGEYRMVTHVGQPSYGPDGEYIGYIGYFLVDETAGLLARRAS